MRWVTAANQHVTTAIVTEWNRILHEEVGSGGQETEGQTEGDIETEEGHGTVNKLQGAEVSVKEQRDG